jgi:hypothetical protein
MGLSFTIAAGPRQRSNFRSESRGTYDHILLSQIRDSPNQEGQVPVFISSRNRVAQVYPQAMGSLFVASYDSQGYGGGMRTRLHTGSNSPGKLLSFYNFARTEYRTLNPTVGVFVCYNLRICCHGNAYQSLSNQRV